MCFATFSQFYETIIFSFSFANDGLLNVKILGKDLFGSEKVAKNIHLCNTEMAYHDTYTLVLSQGVVTRKVK